MVEAKSLLRKKDMEDTKSTSCPISDPTPIGTIVKDSMEDPTVNSFVAFEEAVDCTKKGVSQADNREK